MPSFHLTAKYPINRPNFHVDKGMEMTIHINVVGITPGNLFGNHRCQEQVMRQFQLYGIDAPKNDAGVYNRGVWDVKMV